MRSQNAFFTSANMNGAASVAALLVLTACGGTQAGQTMPTEASTSGQKTSGLLARTVRQNQAIEAVLYSFGSASNDGAYPEATLTSMRGALYGTTFFGGANNVGVVYSMSPSGSETVAHSFGSRRDGAHAAYGLTTAGYGVTTNGGAYNAGTVYRIAKGGKEKVLHSFGSGLDGANPGGALIAVAGTLYGTTSNGGTNGYGTVFSVTSSGTESVLYSFAGGTDGANPYAGLILVNGIFYGTTASGGTNNQGTVYSITTSGTEAVLYRFKGGVDGVQPEAGLTKVGNVLYGTTQKGGYPAGLGTVFKLTSSGKETVLHSFNGPPDGTNPGYGSLLLVNKVLYGTTIAGGTQSIGAIYSITPEGDEAILHSFAGGTSDGRKPFSGLTNVGGVFYGTTWEGGANGVGTVFAIAP